MCGIVAAFGYRAKLTAAQLREVQSACDRIDCRGPDGFGFWRGEDDRVALGHRRLAIIDLSERGSQPMQKDGGRLVISFNGEIYNYRALRSALQARGHRFQSDSDTEVLLHLYDERGADMVRELRGMFAFVLWDRARECVLLARDSFGIKPLYYADTGRALFAASEVKALRAFTSVDTSPDPAGHVGFFLWGHVPDPHTLYRGIRALRAGTTLLIDQSGATTACRYADLSQLLASAEERHEEATDSIKDASCPDALREALLDSVRHHMVADVDVGVFLSAGLDSTTLTALATEVGGRIRTVTLGFEEYRGTPLDETVLADQVAKHYGTDHRTIWVSAKEFRDELPRLMARMDQPSIDGVNSYFVSRAAREAGLKVALSGLGGDELFGGYSSFHELPRLVGILGRLPGITALGRGLRVVSAPLLRRISSPKYAGLLEYGADYSGAYLLRRGLFLPWELPSVLDDDVAREGWRELQLWARLDETLHGLTSDRLRVSALESSWYMRNQLLRDTDWASMSHSLEVRVPLVDWTLWSAVARFFRQNPQLSKLDMARAARPELPNRVLTREKTGFFIPVRDWMLGERPEYRRQRGLRGWAQYVYEAA